MLTTGLVLAAAGTVVNKTAIKQYQQATRDRAKVKTEGGKIIRSVQLQVQKHSKEFKQQE